MTTNVVDNNSSDNDDDADDDNYNSTDDDNYVDDGNNHIMMKTTINLIKCRIGVFLTYIHYKIIWTQSVQQRWRVSRMQQNK